MWHLKTSNYDLEQTVTWLNKQILRPKVSYFVNVGCTGRTGPLSGLGPWGLSLTSLMDDPALAGNTGRKSRHFWHHRTNLLGYIFGTKACIDNRKNMLNSNTCSTCPDNMVNFGLLTALLASMGHPCKCQRVLHLGSVTARHSSTVRQPDFSALNIERHIYSAGRPWRWTLAHISSLKFKLITLLTLC